MNYNDPLDRLLLESIPIRITPAGSHPDGPTAAWRELELERERWALAHEIGDEEVA